MPDEVQQLIQKITPVAIGNVEQKKALKIIEHRFSENRMAAVKRLEAIGANAGAAVPVLTQLILAWEEPRHFKIAAIKALQGIGPAAVQSVNALRQIQRSNDFLLSTAAECAILHIDASEENPLSRDTTDSLFTLLEGLLVNHDEKLVALIREYVLQPRAQPRDKIFNEIEGIVIKSKSPERLFHKLLTNQAGRDLGLRLLNASRFDGNSLTKQMLITNNWSYYTNTLFENLDAREAVARQILEDASADPAAWVGVFGRYQSLFQDGKNDSQQEQLLPSVTWLRRVAAWPNWRGGRVLEWLYDLWSDPRASESYKEEIVVTSRFIIASISDVEVTRFVQAYQSWKQPRSPKHHFVTELIPDFRASEKERERIHYVLSNLVVRESLDTTAGGELLLRLVRGKLSPEMASDLPPPPLVEQFLIDGRFAEGETALLLALDVKPMDNEIRFGLGVLQFVRAIDNFGKGLYEYGAVSTNSDNPFLRLPIPQNPTPTPISYKALGRMLDACAEDLSRAEATLALISDDNVKLRLRLAKITFDFTGTGKKPTTLLDILAKLNGGRLLSEIANPEFRIHFDRGDVAWLRAYCHLLCAMVNAYRAVDLEADFAQRVASVFPNVEPSPEAKNLSGGNPWFELTITDLLRLRQMRLHLVAVCKLTPETWLHIRQETDDDYEWLSHPKQTDQLSLPITDQRIDNWLAMMEQLEGLLQGERLLKPSFFGPFAENFANRGLAINLRKVLDDPPVYLLNLPVLMAKGIDEKYFEVAKNKKEFDESVLIAVSQVFQEPFGFAYAAPLN